MILTSYAPRPPSPPRLPEPPPVPAHLRRPPPRNPELDALEIDLAALWRERRSDLVERGEADQLCTWQARHDELLKWRRTVRASAVPPEAGEMAKALGIARPITAYASGEIDSMKNLALGRGAEAINNVAMEHVHVSLRILRRQKAVLEAELKITNETHAVRCLRLGLRLEEVPDALGKLLERAIHEFGDRIASLESRSGQGDLNWESPRGLHGDLIDCGLLVLPQALP